VNVLQDVDTDFVASPPLSLGWIGFSLQRVIRYWWPSIATYCYYDPTGAKVKSGNRGRSGVAASGLRLNLDTLPTIVVQSVRQANAYQAFFASTLFACAGGGRGLASGQAAREPPLCLLFVFVWEGRSGERPEMREFCQL
jgi:hypothetical protein